MALVEVSLVLQQNVKDNDRIAEDDCFKKVSVRKTENLSWRVR